MKLWMKITIGLIVGLVLVSGVQAASPSYFNFLRTYAAEQSGYMNIFFPGSPATPSSTQVGAVSVGSTPAGAQVFIGNKYYGTTPLTVDNLKAGFYQIQVTAPGYISWSNYFTVKAGTTTQVDATLIPMPPQIMPLPTVPTPVPTSSGGSSGYGSLVITSKPAGATVSLKSNFFDSSEWMLDGKWHDLIGVVTPVYWMNVMPPGSYSIALNRGKTGEWCTTVTIRANETTTINGVATVCPFCGGCD